MKVHQTNIDHPLFLHISKFMEMDINDFPHILAAFNIIKVPKKNLLMAADRLCEAHFFVIKGCLNMYYISENGHKQTVQFAIENWWLTDYLAFGAQKKSEFYIQAVEPTTVLRIDFKGQEELLARYPYLEKYFRTIYQIAYGASLMRVKYQYGLSKEENYFHFAERFPDFVQRVPQYLIASYLGLTPEYVSEIRKKHLS